MHLVLHLLCRRRGDKSRPMNNLGFSYMSSFLVGTFQLATLAWSRKTPRIVPQSSGRYELTRLNFQITPYRWPWSYLHVPTKGLRTGRRTSLIDCPFPFALILNLHPQASFLSHHHHDDDQDDDPRLSCTRRLSSTFHFSSDPCLDYS